MRLYFFLTALFLCSLIVPACAPQTLVAPTITPTPKTVPSPTESLTPQPSFTPTETPTIIPPTPTFGPPAPVADFYVKKSKCILFKPTLKNPSYRVEIWFKLAWRDMSENEDGFWLYRDGNRVAELPQNTVEHIDIFELVKGGRTSTYYVVAHNSAGQTKGELLSYPNPC
ncbi:MAG: hypothetical protein HFACDABA_01787 [Anaerolineales bacterium]|nr:hypothetical protein [Anaerolineales bacterium]